MKHLNIIPLKKSSNPSYHLPTLNDDSLVISSETIPLNE